MCGSSRCRPSIIYTGRNERAIAGNQRVKARESER